MSGVSPGAGRPLPANYKWIVLSNTTIGMLLATINASILLIALPDIFRGIRIDPLAPGNTNYLLWMILSFLIVTAVLASYGAGGSVIGPALAERLDVPFIDRAIPLAVADRLHVPYDDAAAHDEHVSTGWLQRVLSGFVGADTGAPAPLPPEMCSSEDFRRATEEVLLQQAATGSGVILGRGSVVVLRDDPRAPRVRLDGPAARRAEETMRLDASLDRDGAERALRQFDRTHAAYLQQLYGVDIRDSTLYHLALDSTCIELDACVEIIARAARALPAGARTGATNGPPR